MIGHLTINESKHHVCVRKSRGYQSRSTIHLSQRYPDLNRGDYASDKDHLRLVKNTE